MKKQNIQKTRREAFLRGIKVMEERRTGKTYRLILEGLKLASEGKTVFIITPLPLSYVSSMIEKMLPSDIKMSKLSKKVNFPNNGSLTLRSQDKMAKTMDEIIAGINVLVAGASNLVVLWD